MLAAENLSCEQCGAWFDYCVRLSIFDLAARISDDEILTTQIPGCHNLAHKLMLHIILGTEYFDVTQHAEAKKGWAKIAYVIYVCNSSFFNYTTCYVAYFRLILFNVYVLCSLWVYLMLCQCNKFVLLYSWSYWNISLLYKFLCNVLHNILCRYP